jgi:hypothetical protein
MPWTLFAQWLGCGMIEALAWSRRWLGIDPGEAVASRSSSLPPAKPFVQDLARWPHPWKAATPIARTLAERYLRGRGLQLKDPTGRVLRYASQRARKSPQGDLEYHPALLAALSDARTGEQAGIINIYLKPDGRDRLRDRKGKTVTGRAKGAVVMLSDFDKPTAGLILCEGVETGIALLMAKMAPVWACGGAGLLKYFQVLGGIEALTIAADADKPGQQAAETLAARWRNARREVAIIAPPAGDWAEKP